MGHILLSVSTLGDAGLSTAGSASLAGNARPVSRMQDFPMMSCARVPILSMCYQLWRLRPPLGLPPACCAEHMGGGNASSGCCVHHFSQPRRLGGRFCLFCLIKLHFLINKQNVIQRCQELFRMHRYSVLPGVSDPAYPLPTPWQSFCLAGAP